MEEGKLVFHNPKCFSRFLVLHSQLAALSLHKPSFNADNNATLKLSLCLTSNHASVCPIQSSHHQAIPASIHVDPTPYPTIGTSTSIGRRPHSSSFFDDNAHGIIFQN